MFLALGILTIEGEKINNNDNNIKYRNALQGRLEFMCYWA